LPCSYLVIPEAPVSPPRTRVELSAAPDWFARVQHEAVRNGLSLTSFIRMVVSRQLERRARRSLGSTTTALARPEATPLCAPTEVAPAC